MAFKLNDPRPNVLKNKGLLNDNPFKANGNTMAYNNGGPGDPPEKNSTQAETDKAANENVVFDPSTRTQVESDRPGFNKFRTTGIGEAEGYNVGTEKMGNKEWSEWLKTTEGQKYTASKNKEKFDYEGQPDEPTEITTTENPRPKYKPKAQDYIAGEGDKVFSAVSGYRAEKLSGGLSRLAGKRKDVTMFGQKNNISKKDMARQKAAYDAKVMASREKKGKYGAQHLTIAEQEAKENINQLGGGRSSIGDTETGVGQTSKNQTFRKDAQGNMQIQTLNNRGKVIKSESTSPKNDIKREIKKDKVVNASTIDGEDTTV